jgi:alpha-amylase
MSAEKAQKILSPVPYEQGFHFFMPDGHYSGETAMSLCAFLRDLQHLDMQSIRFHLDRGDFQKWLRTTIGDEELARRIDNIDKTAPDGPLIQQLAETVQKRISELQLIDT